MKNRLPAIAQDVGPEFAEHRYNVYAVLYFIELARLIAPQAGFAWRKVQGGRAPSRQKSVWGVESRLVVPFLHTRQIAYTDKLTNIKHEHEFTNEKTHLRYSAENGRVHRRPRAFSPRLASSHQ